MKNRSFRKCLTGACLLMVSLSTAPVLAGWLSNQSGTYYFPEQNYNDKYGDFPPADIEQQIFSQMKTDDNPVEKETSNENATAPASNNQQVLNQPQTYSKQNYSQQYNQQPAHNSYNRGRNLSPSDNQRYNRNTSFSAPWNNSGSGFSGPWNNSGSGFSGPWNNNNNGSNVSMPWGNNNGSNVSMPWGNNNGSNFSPLGDGSSWSW